MMRDAKGLSAEQMNEFRASFNHFDRVSIIFYHFNHRTPWYMVVNQFLTLVNHYESLSMILNFNNYRIMMVLSQLKSYKDV